MAQLGDFLKAINQSKKNIIDEDPMTEKEYLPFVVNRTLSYFLDTVLYANEVNVQSHTDNKMQFDFLLNTIRANRRFSRWLKPEENEDIDAIKEYYGYSSQKARDVLDIFTRSQLSLIHEHLNKGGLKNGRTKRTEKGNST